LIAEADKRKPDLAIVIDSPAFNWRVAREMKKRGVPTVYYSRRSFGPGGKDRVRLLRDYIDKRLSSFPLKNSLSQAWRRCDLHRASTCPNCHTHRRTEEYARRHKLDPAKPWITLCPAAAERSADEPAHNSAAAAPLGPATNYLLPVRPLSTATSCKI